MADKLICEVLALNVSPVTVVKVHAPATEQVTVEEPNVNVLVLLLDDDTPVDVTL